MNDRPPTGPGNTESTAAVLAAVPPQVSQDEPDDMIDTRKDSEHWPFLLLLGGCHDELVKTYTEADRTSKIAQKSHRRWVVFAALFATLAVLMAIAQLPRSADQMMREKTTAEVSSTPAPARVQGASRRMYVPMFELAAVLLAWLAFHVGDKTRKEWLRERHKAERCRFAKFGSIILPDLYKQGVQLPEEHAQRLSVQIEQVKNIAYKDLRTWLSNEIPQQPVVPSSLALAEITQLRDYYCKKRLDFQADYFKRQFERKDAKNDERWRDVLPWFFVGSVFFVGLHVVIHLIDQTGTWHKWEVLALLCAALLPVLASGLRIWRSAREATRNMIRFQAKYLALDSISKRLQGNPPKSVPIRSDEEAEAVLRDLWYAEQMMESEHREWLLLMMEAEWVG
jgi:hypothetical protein